MRKGNEILIFSIIACAILVLEFFYLPWGSINKNSISQTSNVIQGVRFEGGIPNAPSHSSGSSYGGGFVSPTINRSASVGHASYSASGTQDRKFANYSVYSHSSDNDQTAPVANGGGVVGVNEINTSSASSKNSSNDLGGLNFGGLTALNGPLVQTKLNKNQGTTLFQNNSGNADADLNNGLNSNPRMKEPPPPDSPIDNNYVLYMLVMIYLVVKYIQSILRHKAIQKKHVL
jgi:hypothetical protein